LVQEPVKPELSDALAKSEKVEAGPAPLRVAWVASDRTPGVCGGLLEPLAEGLANERVDLTRVHPSNADGADVVGETQAITYRRRRPWDLRGNAILRLTDALRREKVGLLHALEPGAAALTCRLAREMKVPYVVGSFGLDDARALGGLPETPARVFVASEPIREKLAERRVAAEEDLVLVRPGAHCVSRPRCFDDAQRCPTVVVGGPMNHAAPLEAVLRTFAELRDRQYGCAYLLVGAGPVLGAIRRRATELALMRDLTFADYGEQTRFADLVRAGDIYIAAAASRDLDVQCLLAMASGCAVLAPESPSSDFIIDGRTALQFEEGSVADLTVKLTSLLDDRSAARTLGGGALEYVDGRHAVGAASSAIAAVYRSVLAKAN
jgi:glycosyltransferase involved in cell wall biosynthesis